MLNPGVPSRIPRMTTRRPFFGFALCLFLSMTAAVLAGVEKPTCAVMNFQALEGITEGQAKVLTERVFVEISGLDVYQMIERAQAEKVLAENQFAIDCADTDCAVQAGKLLSARYIVVGSVARFGEMFTINSRLVNVETGAVEQEGATDHKGQLEDLLTLAAPNVARQLAGYAAPRQTRSPEAVAQAAPPAPLAAPSPPVFKTAPTPDKGPDPALVTLGVLGAAGAVAIVAVAASKAGKNCDDDHPLWCPDVGKCCPAGYPYHGTDGKCHDTTGGYVQDDYCSRE